jgi:hypothetical protein
MKFPPQPYTEPSFTKALRVNVTDRDHLLLKDCDMGNKINSAFQSIREIGVPKKHIESMERWS